MNFTKEQLNSIGSLSEEGLLDLLKQIEELETYKKYHKIEYWNVYPFQKKMFDAGVDYRSRFACLANRIGKTIAGSMEMTFHLTGKYPEWWTGYKFTKPVKAWAIGITNESTRKVLQNELVGTIDIRQEAEIGTGFIPRDDIIVDSIEKDGPAAKVIRVRWKDTDEYSSLEFRSTQQGVHTLNISVVY